MKITVQRTRKTADGILGSMKFDENPFTCFTVENLEHSIPAGVYNAKIDHSPRMNIDTPHIAVPSRDEAAGGDAGIRIHSANFPSQLLGCIAVGDKQDADAVEDSKATFAKIMGILKGISAFVVEVLDVV